MLQIFSRLRRQLLLIILFDLARSCLWAQPVNDNYRLYTTSEGLPSNQVSCLAQDSYGYLWVGTMQGVSRFNGSSFQNFADDKKSFSSVFCSQILQVNDSMLLIGTASGMVVFNLRHNQFENYRIADTNVQAGCNNLIHCMARLPHHEVLVSSGLYVAVLNADLTTKRKVRKDKWPPYFFKSPVFLDRDSTQLLVGPYLRQMDTRTLNCERLEPYSSLVDDRWTAAVTSMLKTDTTGSILFGLWGQNCYYYNKRDNRLYHHELSDAMGLGNGVSCIFQDRDDPRYYWICTEGGGINRLNLATLKVENCLFHKNNNNLTELDDCFETLQDKEGNMWVATTGGLLRQSRNCGAVRTISTTEYFSGNKVKEIVFSDAMKDSSGRLWVGTFGNWVFQANMDGSPVKHYTDENSPLGHLVMDMKIHNGTLFVSTNYNGLFYYDEISQTFRHPPFLPPSCRGKGCGSFLFDRGGDCWITLGKSVLRLNTRTGDSTFYGPEVTVARHQTDVRCNIIVDDKQGNIWMGLGWWAGKLMTWNREKDSCYTVPVIANGTAQKNIVIRSLFVDSKGDLWIGTFEYGVIKRSAATGTYTQYDRQAGLLNLEVHCIKEDIEGNVWIGTSGGIGVLTKGANRFRCFAKKDGLPGELINNVSFPDKNDPYRMLVLMQNKLCWVDTKILVAPQSNIPTYIERVYVENKIVNQRAVARFSYSQSHFQFEFAGISLGNGTEINYQYMLVGLDKDWISCGNRRFANYAGIPPGRYTFKVRTENIDGNWSEPATWSFVITPPFWKRWWFYLACAALTAAAVYGIYRYQLSKAIAMFNIRNQISRDLHDEVGSTLTSISLLNEMAKTNRSESTHHKISEGLQRVQNAMSDIIWMINPKNDELDNLALRFREMAAEMLEPGNINYKVNIPEGLEHRKITMEKRRQIFMIFRECLTNIVKYADCDKVEISIDITHKVLTMTIADNGRGFDPTFRSSGNGLRNMEGRARQMKGTVAVQTAPGKGTTTELSVPLE